MTNNNKNSLIHLRSLLNKFQEIWDEALNGNYIRTISGELTSTAKDIAKFPDEFEKKLSKKEKILFDYAKNYANVK